MNRPIVISAIFAVAAAGLAGGLYVQHQHAVEWADDCTTIDGTMYNRANYAKAANYTDSEASKFDSRFCVVTVPNEVPMREVMLNPHETHDAAIRRRLPR